MPMGILYSILLVLWFGLLNRHRGGGPPQINKLIKKLTGFKPRSLIVASILMVMPSVFLYLLSLGFASLTASYLASLTGLTFLLWGMSGWGSYMEMGLNPNGYKDKVEVSWIDWVLYLIFGPKWIPDSDTVTQPRKLHFEAKHLLSVIPINFGFIAPDVIKSPTGDVRPKSWRAKRDWVGMMLRGAHAIWFFVLVSWWFNKWWLMLGLLPFCVIFGTIYQVCYSDWFTNLTSKLPFWGKWIGKPDGFFSERVEPHAVAEWGAGLTWGGFILLIFGSVL